MPKRGILIVGLIALIVIITFLALRLRLRRAEVPQSGTEAGPTNLIAASSPAPSFPPCPNFDEKKIMVGTKEITVAVADSATERMHGLSGCPEIAKDSGMYFVIKPVAQATFWMKDMLIPLDIIWIKDGKVTGVAANIPLPLAGQPDALLPQYKSPNTVDAVLELPANHAAALNITTGTTIKPL